MHDACNQGLPSVLTGSFVGSLALADPGLGLCASARPGGDSEADAVQGYRRTVGTSRSLLRNSAASTSCCSLPRSPRTSIPLHPLSPPGQGRSQIQPSSFSGISSRLGALVTDAADRHGDLVSGFQPGLPRPRRACAEATARV